MSAVLDCLMYTKTPGKNATLSYGDPILFNYDYVIDKDVFSRDYSTGEITIFEEGDYLVHWWVVTQTADSARSIGFAIKGRDKDNIYRNYQAAVNPLKTGQVSGSSIISLKKNELPFKFQLVNITGYSLSMETSVVLAIDTTALAGLVISKVGKEGQMGPEGPEGPQGPQGIQGLAGPTGVQGIEGPQGEKGSKGDAGPQGEKGEIGLPGEKGEIGEVGPKGDRGPQGIAGPRGNIGPQGPKGERGIQGIQGPPGGIGKLSVTENYLRTDVSNRVLYQETINFSNTKVNFTMDSMGIGENSAIRMLENGDIELLEAGVYKFNWYLNIEGISQVEYIGFDIVPVIDEIGDYENPLVHNEFPVIIVGQLVGQGVITVNEKTKVRLINSSRPMSDKNGVMSFMSRGNIAGGIEITAYTVGH